MRSLTRSSWAVRTNNDKLSEEEPRRKYKFEISTASWASCKLLFEKETNRLDATTRDGPSRRSRTRISRKRYQIYFANFPRTRRGFAPTFSRAETVAHYHDGSAIASTIARSVYTPAAGTERYARTGAALLISHRTETMTYDGNNIEEAPRKNIQHRHSLQSSIRAV